MAVGGGGGGVRFLGGVYAGGGGLEEGVLPQVDLIMVFKW